MYSKSEREEANENSIDRDDKKKKRTQVRCSFSESLRFELLLT